jgi:hypothetical protein
MIIVEPESIFLNFVGTLDAIFGGKARRGAGGCLCFYEQQSIKRLCMLQHIGAIIIDGF